MSSNFDNLQTVLSWPPEEILRALRDQFANGQRSPQALKWDLLGDTAHNRGALAFRHQRCQEGEAWMRLAIEVFDRLASTGDESRLKDYQRRSMMSRATLISTLGPDEGDPHRSPATIERWLFESLQCSVTDLHRLRHQAEEGNFDAMGRVLELRANLSIIRLLLSKVSFYRAAEIQELLELENAFCTGEPKWTS